MNKHDLKIDDDLVEPEDSEDRQEENVVNNSSMPAATSAFARKSTHATNETKSYSKMNTKQNQS